MRNNYDEKRFIKWALVLIRRKSNTDYEQFSQGLYGANFELERALENDILSMRQIGSREIKDKEGENKESGERA